MKLSEIAFYKTVVVGIEHLSLEDRNNMRSMVDAGYFFVHRVEEDESGLICRYGAVTPDNDVGDVMVGDYGFSDYFGEMIAQFKDAGFDAVHFDIEGDRVDGLTWYTESYTRVKPLGYELPIIGWDDLNEDQKQYARDNWMPEDAESDEDYFGYSPDNFVVIDGKLYNISAECMRCLDGEMAEHGFTGYFSESNTSAVYIKLSDDGEYCDAVRVS